MKNLSLVWRREVYCNPSIKSTVLLTVSTIILNENSSASCYDWQTIWKYSVPLFLQSSSASNTTTSFVLRRCLSSLLQSELFGHLVFWKGNKHFAHLDSRNNLTEYFRLDWHKGSGTVAKILYFLNRTLERNYAFSIWFYS